MKPITNDLVERIQDLEAQQAQLERQLEALKEQGALLRSMLEYERLRWPEQLSLPDLDKKKNGPRLSSRFSRFIVQTLGSYGPQSLDELKRRALQHGLDFEGKNDGRVLHFALVGMAQNNIVKREPDTRKWRLVQLEGERH